MHGLFTEKLWWAGSIFVGLSFVGLASGTQIDRVPAADPDRKFRANFVREFVSQLGLIRQDRTLFLAVLGNTFFYFVAALLQFNIAIYAVDVLKISETQASPLQAALAIGIGLGSFAAGYLSGHKIEYGFIPLGSMGITLFAILLSVPHLSFVELALALAFLGLAGGFFAVPVNALIQHRPDPAVKGAVIGASNLQSWIGNSAGQRGLLRAVPFRSPESRLHFPGLRADDSGRNGLYPGVASGIVFASRVVGAGAHGLSDAHRRTREHSGERRRVAGIESSFIRGRAGPDGVHRSSGPLPHIQGLLRSSVDSSIRRSREAGSPFHRSCVRGK